ncbi:MAG: ParB/RepB/Spo0J family partition protein [Clostridiales bacterium]|nr:ParB/RepB/Spo0J family partition protein [Clostridiales bacterium]
MKEKIENINIDLLIPFENHPFHDRNGMEQTELLQSIKTNGLLEPLIIRPFSDGKYEIISGHRRVNACKELGIQTVPAIIKELNKDEAIIAMVDANLQREHLLPSEKAFAYKMKLEAMKHQGKTSCQVGAKLRTDEQIAETVNDSGRQIQRFIRLTYLIPELLKLVDENKIAFTPAVELSYLPGNEQKKLFDEIEYADATPSLSQAQRLRKFSQQGRFSTDTVFAVLSEEKPNQKEQVRFQAEEIRKYFPRNYSSKDMQETIIKLLEKWQRQRERNAREER